MAQCVPRVAPLSPHYAATMETAAMMQSKHLFNETHEDTSLLRVRTI